MLHGTEIPCIVKQNITFITMTDWSLESQGWILDREKNFFF